LAAKVIFKKSTSKGKIETLPVAALEVAWDSSI